MTVADFPDWQAPQAHADRISVTGVPLITSSRQVLNVAPQALAGGAGFSSALLPVSAIGYEIFISSKCGGTATVPFIEVQLQWLDTASGNISGTDSWICVSGSSSNGGVTVGKGPTKGDQVEVLITNLDAAVATTISVTLVQNNRVYPTDTWYNPNNQFRNTVVPTFTVSNNPDDESVIGLFSAVSIPANGSVSKLCAMWNGLIYVGLEVTVGALSALDIRIRPKPDGEYGGGNILGSYNAPAPGFTFIGAKAPLGVVLANTTASAITVNCGLFKAA